MKRYTLIASIIVTLLVALTTLYLSSSIADSNDVLLLVFFDLMIVSIFVWPKSEKFFKMKITVFWLILGSLSIMGFLAGSWGVVLGLAGCGIAVLYTIACLAVRRVFQGF